MELNRKKRSQRKKDFLNRLTRVKKGELLQDADQKEKKYSAALEDIHSDSGRFRVNACYCIPQPGRGIKPLKSEYTITDEGKPRHIKFESMPVGEAEQAVGMYLRYNAMAQYEESEKLLSADQTKNVPLML